jgi:hypothetical protein
MPFMERDINKATTMIVRNIRYHLNCSKSKTDFETLVSCGAPGIGMFLM